MKRPAFKPADIGVSRPDETGAVTLLLMDGKGNTQEVPLTADQRAGLGQSLISGPPVEGREGPALYLAPTNARVYQRQDGDYAVEFQIGGGRAVHVLLRGLLAEGLHQQLRGMLDSQPPSSAH